mmetsp:Transcript_28402/g.74614  ORF Transcript_28402/g.74614 Transcript_28402/m.74614 type:complete len:247 (+) Transcript_28402:35-775(+)
MWPLPKQAPKPAKPRTPHGCVCFRFRLCGAGASIRDLVRGLRWSRRCGCVDAQTLGGGLGRRRAQIVGLAVIAIGGDVGRTGLGRATLARPAHLVMAVTTHAGALCRGRQGARGGGIGGFILTGWGCRFGLGGHLRRHWHRLHRGKHSVGTGRIRRGHRVRGGSADCGRAVHVHVDGRRIGRRDRRGEVLGDTIAANPLQFVFKLRPSIKENLADSFSGRPDEGNGVTFFDRGRSDLAVIHEHSVG